MTLPVVSVIVLTYNQEATVARALDSILAQRAPLGFYEIVIGDDASSDATREICLDYLRRFPSIVRLMPAAPNKGVVDNYFDTLAACRGRYIADCAGDDWWTDPDRLVRQAAILDADPSLVMAHAGWTDVWPDGRERARLPRWGGEVTDGRVMLGHLLAHTDSPAIHLSTALYRRRVIADALAETPRLVRNRAFGCEDLPLTAALLARGRVACESRRVMAYSVGHSSVSNPARRLRALRFYTATLRCTAALAEAYGVAPPVLRTYYRAKLRFVARLALRAATRADIGRLHALIHRYRLPAGSATRCLLAAAALRSRLGL